METIFFWHRVMVTMSSLVINACNCFRSIFGDIHWGDSCVCSFIVVIHQVLNTYLAKLSAATIYFGAIFIWSYDSSNGSRVKSSSHEALQCGCLFYQHLCKKLNFCGYVGFHR